MDSILTSIKKLLGIDETYPHFDQDIIIHINSALFTLAQLGVGKTGFAIDSDASTWRDFTGQTDDLEAVKTYVYLKVKMVFDPPTSSFVLESMKSMIQEYEWRLNVKVETEKEA